jgi:Putative transposase
VPNAQCGAVSFIQRFDSALRLNLHIHALIMDGVYAADEDDQPQFQALTLPAPDDEEIARLTELLAERIGGFFRWRGNLPFAVQPYAKYIAQFQDRGLPGKNSIRFRFELIGLSSALRLLEPL